jgi:hypothetical protein
MFAHHKEDDKMYPLTTIEIAETQCRDQELKVFLKKNAKNATNGYICYQLIEDAKCYVRMVYQSFQNL